MRAGFAVRQFSHDGGPVTDVTVTYRLTGSPQLGPQVDGVHQRMTDGIQRVFNAPGHRLRDGSLLRVNVVPAAPGETPHLDVTLTDPADGVPTTPTRGRPTSPRTSSSTRSATSWACATRAVATPPPRTAAAPRA